MTDPLTVHTDHPEAVYGISHISLSPENRCNDTRFYKVCHCHARLLMM